MNKTLLNICLLLILSVPAWAQNRQITGQVIDTDTNDPIIGASVMIKGQHKVAKQIYTAGLYRWPKTTCRLPEL
jgi:hypothetical protein